MSSGPSPTPAPGRPGAVLGLPAEGPGSAAGFGRRLAGITVDWIAAVAISRVFLGDALLGPNLVLAVMHVVLVGTVGTSLGHRLCRMHVVRATGGWPGPRAAVVRTLLLLLVVPALVVDADGRGLHDRLAGTVLLRR